MMSTKKIVESEFLSFKGHLINRANNTIYIGDPKEKYIVMLQLQNMKKVGDIDVATNIIVQLQYTDQSIRLKDRIIKKADKDGLYEAVDIGIIWLERALNEQKTAR